MNNKKSFIYNITFILVSLLLLIALALPSFIVDPYFHYRDPKTDKYYYPLDMARCQNDGILKRFDYDSLIIGTSLTANFKTELMNDLFACNSIRTSYFGGGYYEVNFGLATALKSKGNLKAVVRSLDAGTIDALIREGVDNFKQPELYYLYDNNLFNDINYLLNKQVIFDHSLRSILYFEGFENPGLPDRDFGVGERATWGSKQATSSLIKKDCPPLNEELTDKEATIILNDVLTNLTSIADKYPDTTFYYFIPPLSIGQYYNFYYNKGILNKFFGGEKIMIEEILKHDNIKLFSFNNLTYVTCDLNNYKDLTHYGYWVNDMILEYMKNDIGLLTKDNYLDYLNTEKEIYTNYDYQSIFHQEDYEDDTKAIDVLKENMLKELARVK